MVDLSIIIPVYDVEEYIDQCLESVGKLNGFIYEIIVVNDGTRDNSIEHVERFIKSFEGKITLVNKENGGLSSARNEGLKNAEGKYILFLDSDDYIVGDELNKLVKAVMIDNVDIGIGDLRRLVDEKITVSPMSKKRTKKMKNVGILSGVGYGEKVFIKSHNFINEEACLQLYKKDFLYENNLMFTEGIYHEDTLFTYQSLIKANKVKYYDFAFYIYRIRSGSIMTSNDEKSKRKHLIDKFQIANKISQIKKQLNQNYFFIDSMIIDLLFNTTIKNKSDLIIDKSVLSLCKKLTIRARIKFLLLLLFRKKELKKGHGNAKK